MTVADERRAVQSVSQTVAAEVLGFKSAGSLRAMHKAPRLRDGRYSLLVLVPWFIARQRAKDADPLLAGGEDSPALERYRAARAAQEEIKLGEMRAELIQIERVHEFHVRLSTILRAAGERLNRQCGAEAGKILEEALNDAERVLVACDDPEGQPS